MTPDDQEVCGKLMKRAQSTCGRKPGHSGECRTAKALEDHRQRKTERRHGQTLSTPAARARWRLTHRLKRYGLTQDDFDRLLDEQGHACAMCFEPFADDGRSYIDHDHSCCPAEKSSCGKCRRGLLCLRCNTGLGYIERLQDLARSYLDKHSARASPPPLAESAWSSLGVW